MSKVTDTLIVVDAAKILADHGTSQGANYTSLKNEGLGYVFMVATWLNIAPLTGQSGTAQQGQQAEDYQEEEGGEKLVLTVKVGDVARFRSQPLAGRGDYQCFIDKIVANPSSETTFTAFNPAHLAIATTELDATVTPFTQYTPAPGHDYHWAGTALLPGTLQYTVDFSIYDSGLHKQGGFSFQSHIVVTA